ncbi:MAG TPA: chaperone modulator CbpM [Ideonella sp.]|uniref:chaperone modulator CbpM n=1 Tax=Ideonella sp. TaxID=1929293 RepID=UPI002E310E24|nr:chaperone modulator CbpM [Ideonella sp.]HEX5685141.1 chaperone modulator CbpM [Ideonella sp.]
MAHVQLAVDAVVVDETTQFSLAELCRACQADSARLVALVDEGVLEPAGQRPDEWRFSGAALQRARAALRLSRDLDLNPSGTALVIDLLAEIAALRAKLHRAGLA